jgi:hypothetical protein
MAFPIRRNDFNSRLPYAHPTSSRPAPEAGGLANPHIGHGGRKGSNAWQDVKLADVYTIQHGKAVEMRAFSDRREALR